MSMTSQAWDLYDIYTDLEYARISRETSTHKRRWNHSAHLTASTIFTKMRTDMIEATRLWHVGAYCNDEVESSFDGYLCGSEFSCDTKEEAIDWFLGEFGEYAAGYDRIECDHVGYTVYDRDDCIDFYL